MTADALLTRDEVATRGLRRLVAEIADELHDAIDEAATCEQLHDAVALWEANHSNEDTSFDTLVAEGASSSCVDCGADTTPHDDGGRPTLGAWEWYMVTTRGSRRCQWPSC